VFDLISEFYTQYQPVLFWLGIISIIFFLFSIATLPWLVGLIPVDYFITHHEIHWHHMLRLHSIIRNIVGLTLLTAGILMLVLPGQGILTMMLGLSAMNFPGKFQLERWVVKRQGILHALNWIRKKRNVPPLEV
jgi:hypothetical protein